MNKKKVDALLSAMTYDDILPIFVPSYRRPHNKTYENIISRLPEEVRKTKVYYCVREEELAEYELVQPDVNYIIIPTTSKCRGLADTRQFIQDYAAEEKIPYIMDMDDDIVQIAPLHNDLSVRKREPCSKHYRVDELTDEVRWQTIALSHKMTRYIFKRYPDVVLGNLRRQHLSFMADLAQTAFKINTGSTPRQTTFVNVKQLTKLGVKRDPIFNKHGDDIGFAAVLLKRGDVRMFSIPCIVYGYVDEKISSVIRDASNAKEYHAYEYKMLQKYPIRDYLRISFRDEDGDYMWGDVDWPKYHKVCEMTHTKELIKWDKELFNKIRG